MGLIAAEERLLDCLPEWGALLPAHFAETAMDREAAPLDPDFDRYVLLDHLGVVSFVTLRDAGRLVGYYLGFIMPDRRHGPTAAMDLFWVSPAARGRHGGVRLLREAERVLRCRGARRWFVGEKLNGSGTGRLFRALGFTQAETFHSLMIGY